MEESVHTIERISKRDFKPLSRGGANQPRPSTSVWNVGKGGWRDEKGFQTGWMKDGGRHREKFCNRIPCNADCRDTFANFPLFGIESNERGGGGVGTGAFADRKFKRSTYLIRWLNGSRSSLEFSSFAFETFNVAPVFGRGIGNEIHESGPQSSVLQQRPYSQKRIPSNRDGE